MRITSEWMITSLKVTETTNSRDRFALARACVNIGVPLGTERGKKIKVCANESRYPRAHTGCPRISWMPPGRLESTTNRDEFLIFPSLCAEKKTPFPQGWLNCADFRYDDSAGRFESGRGSELEITLSRYKERKREKRRGRSMESPAVQNARGD